MDEPYETILNIFYEKNGH